MQPSTRRCPIFVSITGEIALLWQDVDPYEGDVILLTLDTDETLAMNTFELRGDLAQRFNHRYKKTFRLPEPYILKATAKIATQIGMVRRAATVRPTPIAASTDFRFEPIASMRPPSMRKPFSKLSTSGARSKAPVMDMAVFDIAS